MIYTLAHLVEYARSRDGRLEEVDAYSNVVMEKVVEEALVVLQNLRPIFSTTETYDLEQDIVTDELTEIEIILQREPQSIRNLVDYDDIFFTYEITANNHVIMKVTNDKIKPESNYKVTVNYFYYPLLPFTQIELSMDTYLLLRETIAIAAYSLLRDYEQEQVHRNKVKLMAQESSLDLEKGILDFPETRLSDGSWV